MKLISTPVRIFLLAGIISMAASCKTAYQATRTNPAENFDLSQERDTLAIARGEISRRNFFVNEPDTVIYIRDGRVAYTGMLLNGFSYHLYLYEDHSIYQLSMSLNPGASDVHIIWYVSWGDYKVRGKRILFSDRIAGFKMEATVEPGVGMKFHKEYLPQINENVWKVPNLQEGVDAYFWMEFDKEKAARYRKAYDRKYREPFEFTPGIYNNLEIGEDGRWIQKNGDVVLAEGTWRRKRNILILHCPKLRCNFYMTIGEKRLTGMLLLRNSSGMYYYSPEEYAKFFQVDQ